VETGQPLIQRLGKNTGRYCGECIDIDACRGDVKRAAHAHGWLIETLPCPGGPELFALKRLVPKATTRIYISTGIHGDEPAGPLAIRQLLQENVWPDCADLWLVPCLNPTGFPLNTRECAAGIDLNRDYRHLRTPEIRAHVAWLEKQPLFDISFCVHEDWEAQGFYLYELNPDRMASVAEPIVAAVREVCPIDHSTLIDGRPAVDGIIRPNFDPASRPEWAEAFYLITSKTRLSYTLESPSDFALSVRVKALATAVQTGIKLACRADQRAAGVSLARRQQDAPNTLLK
jgi:murein peptide amidase A